MTSGDGLFWSFTLHDFQIAKVASSSVLRTLVYHHTIVFNYFQVVDTIEKQASMEQEYANFMKELDEAKQEEEQREENEEYVVAIERDIELIDEQVYFNH